MIYIDNSNLEQDAIDGKAYSANYLQGCKGIKSVTLNGIHVDGCIYANIDRGFVIAEKKSIDGNLVVIDGSIVYEILFGKVEVIFRDGMEQQTEQL